MTSQQKQTIHQHLSAYRIGPAIELIEPLIAETATADREKLAKLTGQYEHFQGKRRGDYTPLEIRNENDALVKQLQLLLSRIPIVEKPRSIADILGRELDPEFKDREKDPEPEPAAHSEEAKGFTGTIGYQGSPSAKRTTVETDKSYGATYHRCVQALRAQNVEIERGDREGGTLKAMTAGNSHARFGEQILLWITPLPQGKTRVELVVDSNLKETVFDMGRHQKMLDALAHKIKYG
ncbi:hypothetical protein [Lewinella sp. 4G2]|uniref:hypothetical protein n=1 Tax=Lewinella sp. 4G2 TaxID=1803372 RepID=UPI0007B4C7C7|nr:hypothetical protein [Lewinella sp. 4G2]OAV45045.1 hypothetical protein A3850_011345 [Lewinella sp. 4G2]